jgi:hypothetical protein
LVEAATTFSPRLLGLGRSMSQQCQGRYLPSYQYLWMSWEEARLWLARVNYITDAQRGSWWVVGRREETLLVRQDGRHGT